MKEDSGDATTYVVRNVLIIQNDNYKELTIISPQVQELLEKPITPTKEVIEAYLLNVIPLQINIIESPKERQHSVKSRKNFD